MNGGKELQEGKRALMIADCDTLRAIKRGNSVKAERTSSAAEQGI